MRIQSIVTLVKHPLTRSRPFAAIYRFFKRGVITRICKHPIIYPFIDGTKLVVEKGMASAEIQLYTGLYEFSEMAFVLHFLQKEDTFVDVGANVGVYTVLASGVKKCKSISIEPIPTTFVQLENNILINKIQDKVIALNVGVSDSSGTLSFISGEESSVNRVHSEDQFANGNLISVNVDSLDNLLAAESPGIIKIDVEGFETKVIRGAINTLKKESLYAVIIELNGLSNKFGFSDEWIHQQLLNNSFVPYYYNPVDRSFTRLESYGMANTLYIRDIGYVTERVRMADKIAVMNKWI